jgi:hypothetical protein
MKKILLKIPLLISLVGSFSWLIFPEDSALAADRWIVLTGIFLSVFAGYGIMHVLVKKSKSTLSSIAAGLIFTAFAAIGLAYSVMPSDNPFILYKAAGTHIQSFVPLTMQFNSLDIRDNKNLLSAIAWINENTEHDAIIVGEKHWRGFMELHLAEGRRYLFSDDPYRFAVALRQQSNHIYLISAQGGSQTNFTIKDMSRR